MEPIYERSFSLSNQAVDCFGRLKPSHLLAMVQEVSQAHSQLLGGGGDVLEPLGLFWAVTRHRVEITRLPDPGEQITLQTWPCPTTRVAYPRAAVARDARGQELFRVMSLWVLMDANARSLVLPGKSGVDICGTVTGTELAVPSALAAFTGEQCQRRTVRYTELDTNGHMNNTCYLNWVEDLLPSAFHREHPARAFTLCYLNEAREGREIDLHWHLGDALAVNAVSADGENTRIFGAKVEY